MPEPIQVFEHDVLRVGEQGLTARHFDALVKFNQRHGDRFFTVRYQSLRFGSYVGVLQVGKLTIEVLPKADRSVGDKTLWRDALIEMLRCCGHLRARLPTWADLHLQRTPLLNLYLEAFLFEVDSLIRQGLVKRYRREHGNLPVLRGRLALSEHVRRNIVHKERFYTDHDRYDRDNDFNQILKAAVSITATAATTAFLRSRARFIADSFEQVSTGPVSESHFSRLRYDRKTERYRRAISLARLIILNYQPDAQAGGQNVLAILCDMNTLFEEYIYNKLRAAASRKTGVHVRGQRSHLFWCGGSARRSIRPDIEVRIDGHDNPLVIDTKWKVPSGPSPSDSDLKQMFAYNARLRSQRSFLLYPRTDDRENVDGQFFEDDRAQSSECSMLFVDLFRGCTLNRNLGDLILDRVLD